MLPYCYEKLAEQQQKLSDMGREAWLEENLREPPPKRGHLRVAQAASA
jgi:hypothetical protein